MLEPIDEDIDYETLEITEADIANANYITSSVAERCLDRCTEGSTTFASAITDTKCWQDLDKKKINSVVITWY